jgi:hypothetical protein
MQIISASINLSLIPKDKIKTKHKNGTPYKNGAQYFDVQIMINDSPDKYGNNVAIIVGQTKEEREQKSAKTYLGNGKVVWSSAKEEPKQERKSEDGLPF